MKRLFHFFLFAQDICIQTCIMHQSFVTPRAQPLEKAGTLHFRLPSFALSFKLRGQRAGKTMTFPPCILVGFTLHWCVCPRYKNIKFLELSPHCGDNVKLKADYLLHPPGLVTVVTDDWCILIQWKSFLFAI